jgi:hypothetical protein
MDAHITLYAYIIGLNSRSFSVTLAKSETVGNLAEAILKKRPNDLKNVDADRLDLYKVSLPDDATLKQSACQPLDQKLDVGSEELSQLFPINPPAETVSIIVDIQGVGE